MKAVEVIEVVGVVESVIPTEAVQPEQEERQQVMQRRQRRQLNQKVRIQSANDELNPVESTDSPTTAPAALIVQDEVKLLAPSPATADEENSHERSANNENGMPRRSRRSPRHLRVSGQRRRRYRDERYPTQSAMPLAGAFASPELASGKVWVHYPVTPPQEQQVAESTIENLTETAANLVAPIAAAQPEIAAVAPVVVTPVAETSVETVIAAPVAFKHQPGGSSSSAAAVPGRAPVAAPVVEPVVAEPVVAEPIVATLETAVAPAVETVTTESVIETPVVETPAAEATEVAIEAVVAQEAVVEEAVVEEAVTETVVILEPVTAEVETAAAAPALDVVVEKVTETVAAATPIDNVVVAEEPAAATVITAIVTQPADHPEGVRFKHHAFAPMTKAPASVASAPQATTQGEWQRPSFDFAGKGSAGGHAAISQATAPVTKPQSVK